MGNIPRTTPPPPDTSLSLSGVAADSKIVGDKFNNLPKTLEYIGSVTNGGTFQLEAYRVYLGVYYHPVHSVCIGMYLLHRGTVVQSDTNVVPIVSCGHVTSIKIDTSNVLHLSTDSWGGDVHIYKFTSM